MGSLTGVTEEVFLECRHDGRLGLSVCLLSLDAVVFSSTARWRHWNEETEEEEERAQVQVSNEWHIRWKRAASPRLHMMHCTACERVPEGTFDPTSSPPRSLMQCLQTRFTELPSVVFGSVADGGAVDGAVLRLCILFALGLSVNVSWTETDTSIGTTQL